MASPGPSAPNAHPSTPDDSHHPALFVPVHALEPPSPDGVFAATILTHLSDNRPPTSHGDQMLDEDTDVDGGIPLLQDHLEQLPLPGPATAQFSAPTHSFYAPTIGSFTNHSNPPLVVYQAGPDTMEQAIAAASFHLQVQDVAPTTYEEHLNMQDNSGFLEPNVFYPISLNVNTPMCLKTEQDLDFITQADLEGDQCDFQGIRWPTHMSRAMFRQKRTAFERAKVDNKLWYSRGQVCPY